MLLLRCVVQFVALESLKVVANLLPKSSKTSTKSNQRCTRGGKHRSKGQRFQKQSAKKRAVALTPRANVLNGSHNLTCWRILGNLFVCLSVSFIRWFSTRLFVYFGINFSINFMTFEDSLDFCWNQLICVNVHGAYTRACFLGF